MIVLSPRAVERLESYTPSWPMPKIFRMTKGGKLIDGIFSGETIKHAVHAWRSRTISTPLRWARRDRRAEMRSLREPMPISPLSERLCGQKPLARASGQRPGDALQHLRMPFHRRSRPSAALDVDAQAAFAKGMVSLLDKEGAALDIGAYRDAPPGLRIWAGGTVETSDLEALMPWLDWAFRHPQGCTSACLTFLDEPAAV